ncbi:MAG: protein arginine kinase [Verrucomicrobia bacterium]|nr:protein arginine kinase [Verrucomicrobiota bacterium]
MNLNEFLKNPMEWVETEGPQRKIVLSSRIRFARNLCAFAFPGWAKKPERQRALAAMLPAVERLPEMSPGFSASMDSLSALDKQLLVERHLISREHAARNVGSGVVINEHETLSVMINEEDHLRMQALKSGLQLKSAYKVLDKVDSALELHLDYAFSPRLGYLTACPTNVGTGMRASAMLHLPAMVLSEQINQVIQAVGKLGLAVRGLYGEGTEALGNVFQISNQTTLGEREAEVIERLNKVVLQIIEHEENARLSLLEKKPRLVYDQIGRAYGILTNARAMSSKEALNLLSMVRMGADLGLFPTGTQIAMDELFILTQPAHVQKAVARKLTAEERDLSRADVIRARLKELPQPREDIAEPPADSQPEHV